MKKLLTALAMATMIAGTAQADMTNPVNQAKVESSAEGIAFFSTFNKACGDTTRQFAVLEKGRKYLGTHFARPDLYEMDMTIIDMKLNAAIMNIELSKDGKMQRVMKANPTHPDVKEFCEGFPAKTDEFLTNF